MAVTKLTVNKSLGTTKSSKHRVRAALHQLEQKIKAGDFDAEIVKKILSIEGRINNFASFHPGEANAMKLRLQTAKVLAQSNPLNSEPA